MSKVPPRSVRYPMVPANKALNFGTRHKNPPADATHSKSLCHDQVIQRTDADRERKRGSAQAEECFFVGRHGTFSGRL